jgi:hypothetical protein
MDLGYSNHNPLRLIRRGDPNALHGMIELSASRVLRTCPTTLPPSSSDLLLVREGAMEFAYVFAA